MTADGKKWCGKEPDHPEHMIEDLAGLRWNCGGSQTDAIGYVREFQPDHTAENRPVGVKLVAPHDPVSHPTHYRSKVPGIECIEVVQHFNFNQGNVIKYVWRAGDKGNIVEDLKKARQYLDFEIERIERLQRE